MQLNRRAFSTLCTAAVAYPGAVAAQLAKGLPRLPNLRVVRAGDSDAAVLSDGYATQFRSTPLVRAMCGDTVAMRESLLWARETGAAFAIRSGGHCFEGFSQHDRMVIDTRDAKQISIDPVAGRVTIGSGVRVGPLYQRLADAGWTLPAGTHANVGMAGHTLGGGFGYFARRDGLLIDQLVSATVVTADGTIVEASDASHPELFWALRGGGGGQFGIVATMTFTLQRARHQHWINLVEPVDAKRAAEILFIWQRWSAASPRHLCTHLGISRRGDAGFLVTLKGLSGGDRDGLMREMKLLMRTNTDFHPSRIRSGRLKTLLPHMVMMDPSMPHANLRSKSHLFAQPLNERGTLDFLKTMLSHPSATVSTNFESLGGAVSDVSSTATAYPHRRASFVVHLQGNAGLRAENEEAIANAMADFETVLAPRATGGVYVNYPDRTLSDWGRSYWGENLSRLKTVKRRYDPENVFDHAHSIARA